MLSFNGIVRNLKGYSSLKRRAICEMMIIILSMICEIMIIIPSMICEMMMITHSQYDVR